MDQLEATFRIVTPLFPGGAEPKNVKTELRLPLIKGVLQFILTRCARYSFR